MGTSAASAGHPATPGCSPCYSPGLPFLYNTYDHQHYHTLVLLLDVFLLVFLMPMNVIICLFELPCVWIMPYKQTCLIKHCTWDNLHLLKPCVCHMLWYDSVNLHWSRCVVCTSLSVHVAIMIPGSWSKTSRGTFRSRGHTWQRISSVSSPPSLIAILLRAATSTGLTLRACVMSATFFFRLVSQPEP